MNEIHERIARLLGWSPEERETYGFSLQTLRDCVRLAYLPEGYTEKDRARLIADLDRVIRTGRYVREVDF